MWEDVPQSEPKAGEILIRQTAIGLNYIDVYFRNGVYKTASLPATLGMEAAGVITALGAGVAGLNIGDRVAYAAGPLGAYATERTIAADRVLRIPDSIDDVTAAAMMLQGLTAQYLLCRTFKVKSGQTILVHAAAGGVGLILCQWARSLGCSVIGVVSTSEKAELARSYGASHVLVGTANLVAEVKKITGGDMVPVVYDSVGRDTFEVSIDCLAPLGMMVSYGSASGPTPPVDLAMLSAKGSLFITRPTLATYTAKRSDLLKAAEDLFSVITSGNVKISVKQTFSLEDAASAHRALEGRQTTGSTVLLP
jgi:NADPH2:quinone reductase